MPRCNLVVRFDPPMQYRSYIQSKARARAHSSYFIMLVDRAKKDHFTQDLHDFREIDKVSLKSFSKFLFEVDGFAFYSCRNLEVANNQ